MHLLGCRLSLTTEGAALEVDFDAAIRICLERFGGHSSCQRCGSDARTSSKAHNEHALAEMRVHRLQDIVATDKTVSAHCT